MKKYFVLLLAFWGFFAGLFSAKAQIITTIAGNGIWAHNGDGGPAVNAQLGSPVGIYVDSSLNIYFTEADTGVNGNYYIRKINSNGIITTVAGGGDLDWGMVPLQLWPIYRRLSM